MHRYIAITMLDNVPIIDVTLYLLPVLSSDLILTIVFAATMRAQIVQSSIRKPDTIRDLPSQPVIIDISSRP